MGGKTKVIGSSDCWVSLSVDQFILKVFFGVELHHISNLNTLTTNI
jgi:hypothetical protein